MNSLGSEKPNPIKPNRQRPILNGAVNFPLTLAPMVGLSHVALRLVVRRYLPKNAVTLWPTEMLNSRRLPNEDLTRVPETMRAEEESELVPQILGNEERAVSLSVQKLVHEWGASAIDINMGCPVQKALKHNYGVALMGDAKYAASVVAMAVRSSSVPVAVKLRAVEANGEIEKLVPFVRGLQEAGASWICLHPRTAEQKRRGQADWEQIKKLRELVRIPVVGNGDIQVWEDVIRMREETGCDLVMSGRALAARPWMVWQVGEQLGFETPLACTRRRAPQTASEEGAEYGVCLRLLIDLCERYFGENLGLRKIRFYVRTTSVWLLFGQELVSLSTRAKTISEFRDLCEKFFAVPVEMLKRTELRQ